VYNYSYKAKEEVIMSDLGVTSITIEELLDRLKGREWKIPQFQREFVWSVGDVIELIQSILSARPIGMATIWEQPDFTTLELGPLSLLDRDNTNTEISRYFSVTAEDPRKIYAVLDGLQRCTAIALAFGGFRTQHGDYRTSGRFYLNVAAIDPLEQILFIKEKDVIEKNYDKDATCISQGLFPLSSNMPGEKFLGQWLRYFQSIRDSSYYVKGQLPHPEELDRRNLILNKAFEGIIHTKLAVYIVPDSYTLSDICDIFQKLNTTGTKVSTVDLIHSWIYADTAKDVKGPIRLREWIDDLGQKDGAIGWSDSIERPELPVQIATAIHVALETKIPPRKVGRGSVSQIISVKSGDLLATPTDHWKLIIDNDGLLADYLKDFQRVVVSGPFPWNWCPYPVSAAIYVALRFHAHFDAPETHPWGIDDLNALYKAFFWRNALTNRYDQGFLTQLGTDIKEIKRLLSKRRDFDTANQWVELIDIELKKLIDKPLPTKEHILEYLTDGRPTGAMQKALYLPMMATADKDLLNGSTSLKFSGYDSSMQLHHIYPRDWCRNNIVGKLSEYLDIKIAGRDWVNSVSNLMPLSRSSNNLWKTKNPGQVLSERKIVFEASVGILKSAFIDKECFTYLQSGAEGIGNFWKHRADLMAEDFLAKMNVTI
jgi:hypothetical protein